MQYAIFSDNQPITHHSLIIRLMAGKFLNIIHSLQAFILWQRCKILRILYTFSVTFNIRHSLFSISNRTLCTETNFDSLYGILPE